MDEKEGRMEKIGHKEQPREDRTLLGRGWPERRLRQRVAVDKWGERGCIQFEGDCPRDAFVAVRLSGELEHFGVSG